MEEIWKDIVGYIGLYIISNYGKINSCQRNGTRGGVLKPSKCRGGYLQVVLSKNGIHKTHRIHRLVLEAFIGPCPRGKEVCHNDGNPQNNRLDNLRWDTRKENCKDRKKHGNERDQNGSKNNMAKLNDWIIRIVTRLTETEILTQKEIAKIFGVSQPAISYIKSNKRWKHPTENLNKFMV